MKHYKLLLWILILYFGNTGCEQNEIDLYKETPRLNFYKANYSVSFNDADYVQGIVAKEWKVRIDLQGERLPEAKDFCLKASPSEDYSLKAVVSFDEKYTFSADSISQFIYVHVKRPDQLTSTTLYRSDICFDLENPLHQFEAGREDLESLPLEVSYQIRRTNWDEWYWGKYSDVKYFFMMDHFKATLDDIPHNNETQLEIYNAYETYKQTNPPLLDEDGEEIVFKQ